MGRFKAFQSRFEEFLGVPGSLQENVEVFKDNLGGLGGVRNVSRGFTGVLVRFMVSGALQGYSRRFRGPLGGFRRFRNPLKPLEIT